MKVIATFGCLTAGHRVLTADLKWRNVEHLKKGDRLLSFTEKLDTVSNNRYFCESTVVENKPIIKNTYRIYLSDGTIIDASEEHPFLINYGHDKYKWVQTQELFKRKIWCENHSRKWRIEFTRIITPWEKNTSYEAGYLSGFFDGEGSLCMSLKTKRGAYNEHTFRVDACQNNNEMFKTVKKFCKDLGIHIGISKKQRDKKILQISIRGGYCRILEFLGRIRPPRLMAKFNVNKMGRIRNTNKNKTYIENIEFIGEKTVWGLGTTSKTYIAEGFMCHNTPYHTSTDGDDWENIIKDSAQIDKIGAHEWINVNGLIFDIKHHIGSSSVPYGRHTAISKEALWNELWALTNMQPRADVIIRSHVHYFTHCGTSGKLCMTLPALQGLGSKFGAKLCSGLVDWGVVLFEITSKTDYNWYPIIRRIKAQKAGTMKL